MKQIQFNTHQTTSNLGFGCVKLTSCKNEKDAIKSLQAAFDEGVTHFDVARVYGLGKAEGILGKFIKDKRSLVSITTKFGINPPNQSFFFNNQKIINLAKKAIKSLPFIYKKVVNQTGGFLYKMPFDANEARKSVEKSLSELKSDYIDFLFLHEYTLERANDLEVIDFLNTLKSEGKILNFGIGTHLENLTYQLENIDPLYEIIQFNSSLTNDSVSKISKTSSQKLSIHGVYSGIPQLFKDLKQNTGFIQKIKETLGIKELTPEILMDLSLSNAQYSNPNGLTLFTSTNPINIKKNIAKWNELPFSYQEVDLFKKIIQVSP